MSDEESLTIRDKFMREASRLLAQGQTVILCCDIDPYETVFTPVPRPDGTFYIRSESRLRQPPNDKGPPD